MLTSSLDEIGRKYREGDNREGDGDKSVGLLNGEIFQYNPDLNMYPKTMDLKRMQGKGQKGISYEVSVGKCRKVTQRRERCDTKDKVE